jgi:transketolase
VSMSSGQNRASNCVLDSVRAAAAAGSGHPTSSMSTADLIAMLLAKYSRYDFDRLAEPLNDHLIFLQGHASPLLYPLCRAAGAISDTSCCRSGNSGAGSRVTRRMARSRAGRRFRRWSTLQPIPP